MRWGRILWSGPRLLILPAVWLSGIVGTLAWFCAVGLLVMAATGGASPGEAVAVAFGLLFGGAGLFVCRRVITHGRRA